MYTKNSEIENISTIEREDDNDYQLESSNIL